MPDSTDAIIARLEQHQKRTLDENEVLEIQQYYNGKALAQLQAFPGWKVVIELLEGYAKKAINTLVKLSPGDEKAVLGYHAAAFAAQEILDQFQQYVALVVEFSQHEPEILKNPVPGGIPKELL